MPSVWLKTLSFTVFTSALWWKIVMLSGAFVFSFLASISTATLTIINMLLLLLLLFLLYCYYYYYYFLFIGFGRGGSGWYSYCHKRCWMAFKENHKFHHWWIIIAMRSEGWSLVNFFPSKHFLLQVLVPEVLMCYILSGLLYFIPLHLFYLKSQIMFSKYVVKVMVTICMFA